MLTSDDPTRTAELLALSFAWEPARFSRRVHEIPSVMRAGPSDPMSMSRSLMSWPSLVDATK